MHTSQGRPGAVAPAADAAPSVPQPTLAQQRLAICKQCPERKTIGFAPVAMDICGKCGCPLMNKTKLTRATCPLSKW